MRGSRLVSVTAIGLTALVGCTLLVDIPDDLTSGSPDSGRPAARADAGDDVVATPPKDANADVTDAPVAPPDANEPAVVAVDTIGPGANGTGGTGVMSPLVWSHTTHGANRALFVAVAIGNSPDSDVAIDTITYESAPFTRMKTQHSNNDSVGYVSLWVLTNPADGTHPVSVAFTGAPHTISAGSISFSGVDQQQPYLNLVSAGGNGTKADLTVSSAPGDMVIAAFSAGCTISEPAAPFGWHRNNDCLTAGGNAAESAAPGAPSVGLSYLLNADSWGIIGADVKAAPSP